MPIVMAIFLEITPAGIRAPVTTSFTFLPFLLCTVALSFFWDFFNVFLPVIHWCFYKCIFRIFFPKFLQHRFSSMYQSALANFILNVFWNWGVIILLRLSVWFYLVTNDGYFWTLPNTEDRNGGTSSSDFPLFFFVTVF